MDTKKLQSKISEHFTIKPLGESIRFQPKAKPCGRCGDLVEGQRLTLAKKTYEYRTQFWQIKCNSCELNITVKDLAKFKKE